MPRHQAMEDAAMPFGPVHHRGDTKFPFICGHLCLFVDPISNRTYTHFARICRGFLAESASGCIFFSPVRWYIFGT
jgi:hypothetical protein